MDKRHVVIVGGGFAGLGCAQRLAGHDRVRVTLLDRNNYHQFQPLLYQVATSQLAPSDIAHSLRSVFVGEDNVDVKLADVATIDPATRTVTSTDGQQWSGDVLVLAGGSQPNFFDTPGAPEHSFPLYSLDDATRLRSRILGLFEQADRHSELLQRGALNFVVDLPVRLPERAVDPGDSLVTFCMVELQLLDQETALANERGRNSHARYKKRQLRGVLRRLSRGLVVPKRTRGGKKTP